MYSNSSIPWSHGRARKVGQRDFVLGRPSLIRSFGWSRAWESEGGLRKVCLLREVSSYRDLQYKVGTTGLVPVRYR
jgi:hypothetical protein